MRRRVQFAGATGSLLSWGANRSRPSCSRQHRRTDGFVGRHYCVVRSARCEQLRACSIILKRCACFWQSRATYRTGCSADRNSDSVKHTDSGYVVRDSDSNADIPDRDPDTNADVRGSDTNARRNAASFCESDLLQHGGFQRCPESSVHGRNLRLCLHGRFNNRCSVLHTRGDSIEQRSRGRYKVMLSDSAFRAVTSLGAALLLSVLTCTPALPAPSGGGGGAASASNSANPSTTAASTSNSASANTSPSPPPAGLSGYQNPSTLLRPSQETLYILVFGPDAATTNFVAYETSVMLSEGCSKSCLNGKSLMALVNGSKPLWVLPEPAWTLADFTTQCYNDPANTAGALILYDIENDTGSWSAVVYQQGYTRLYARAILVTCGDATQDSGLTTRQKSRVMTRGNAQTTTTDADASVIPPKTTDSKTTTSPTGKTVQTTTTTTMLPKMTIVWQNADEIGARSGQGAVPFVGLAALGAYLAQRFTKSVVSSQQITQPSTVTTGKSIQTTTATTTNTSDLPFSFALLASSVSALNSVTIGGINQTTMLKTTASGLARRLAELIGSDCSDNSALSAIFNCNVVPKVRK